MPLTQLRFRHDTQHCRRGVSLARTKLEKVMATDSKEQKIDEILGKALRDRDFRSKLTSDPKAAAEDCGLSVEEMDLIAGGLAIGDSLLNPQTVAWCTNKGCNETGSIR